MPYQLCQQRSFGQTKVTYWRCGLSEAHRFLKKLSINSVVYTVELGHLNHSHLPVEINKPCLITMHCSAQKPWVLAFK